MNSILSRAGEIVHSIVDSIKIRSKYDTKDDDSIQVCVRIRPILGNEREDSSAWIWKDKTISPRNYSQASYSFDHLFLPENSNSDIFESVIKNTVLKSMQGYHGTVITYGQTNSGKTFTMNGTYHQPGIIPQSIHFCFDSIQEHFTDREFLIRVSYLEVYNEQVKDLLSTEPTQIKIQHDAKLGTILSGVLEQVVLNAQQVMALLKAGEAHRHVGNTDMNEKSSRAHTLLKLTIESKKRSDSMDIPVQVSVLNLVDLAGSENAKMTNCTGDRAREAKCINQSLLTLSIIIQRLSNEKSDVSLKQYLPYRDSKLTRLLQSSLSGKAQIAIICTVSPTVVCVDESHNTLKFAARAKTIKTKAHINEMLDDKTLLRAYKNEIQSLKARLAAVESQTIERMQYKATAINELGTLTNESEITIQPNIEIYDSAANYDETQDTDANYDEDESTEILQMISEMERLILKADLTSVINKSSSNLPQLPPKKLNSKIQQINKNDTRLRYGNPSRLSSIWNSSKSSFPKSSDKLTKAKGNDLVEITDAGNVDTVDTVGTEGTSNLIPPAVSYVDSIEKAVPESRWKKDAVWRNIESPLIPFDLTDDEVHSIGSAAFHTADSCTTDDCIAPAHGINHLNATYDKRTSLTTVLQSQKFGFVPKIALTQSSKDLAKDINSENCTSYSMIEQKMQIDKSIPCAVEDLKASPNNNDHVQALFGVSEMLTVLKHYVRNSSTIKRQTPQYLRIPLTTDDQIQHGIKNEHPAVFDSIDNDYEVLALELKNKDNLLSMLTDGLREVETNQARWLADNDMLFQDLEEALNENRALRERNSFLEEVLQLRNLDG